MSAHLCLGTASWGEPYNGRVPPSRESLQEILSFALEHDVRWLDTARHYVDAERRIGRAAQPGAFNVVTKFKTADLQEGGWEPPLLSSIERLGCSPAAVLLHLEPGETVARTDMASIWMTTAFGQARGFGVSAYTPEQAEAAMDHGAVVLQVPWNMALPSEDLREWDAVQRRAYLNGVLFFGRQPFAKGVLAQSDLRREAFEWALRRNPRGWCVVGVEDVDQLYELVGWWEDLR